MTGRSVPRELALSITLALLLLAGGAGLAGYRFYQEETEHTREQVRSGLSAVAVMKAQQIAAWRRERIADAQVAVPNLMVSRALSRFLNGSPAAGQSKDIAAWLRTLRQSNGYENVLLLDSKGRVRLAASNGSRVAGRQSIALAAESIRSGRVLLSDLHRDEDFPRIHLDLFAPVMHDCGAHSVGALLLRVDPQVFLYPHVQFWPAPSRTAATVLVRGEGSQAVILNQLRHHKNTALTLRLPTEGEQLSEKRAMREDGWNPKGIDSWGARALAAIAQVPDSPWLLVAKVDRDEIDSLVRRRARTAALAAAVLILAGGASVGLLLWRQRACCTAWREEAAQMQRKCAEQVIEAQEEERRRIAQELHDETAQSLTSVLVGLRNLRDSATLAQARQRARQLCELVRAAIDEVRRLARRLHPRALEELGFPAAVERYVADFIDVHGIPVDLQMSGLDSLPPLPPAVSLALYRAVQESLTNAARHAGASAISVVIQRCDAHALAIIEDNGKGFPAEVSAPGSPVERGLGLYGIRQRAAVLGGSVTIESTPGGGTTLHVRIPLNQAGDD